MKTAIFIDIQNIYYTTRDTFRSSFNYRKFLQDLEPKNDIIKTFAYAIDRKDEKQQKFQHALRSMGIDVKLKPYISRSDGSNKGDWDVGITIDILDYAKKVEKIILLSGDGDFDILASYYTAGLFWYENDGNQSFLTHIITRIIRNIKRLNTKII